MVRAIQAGVGWWGINWVTSFNPSVPQVEMVGYIARSDKSKASLAAAGVLAELISPSVILSASRQGEWVELTEVLS